MKKIIFTIIAISIIFLFNSCDIFKGKPKTPSYFLMKIPLDINTSNFENLYKKYEQKTVKHGNKKIDNVNYKIYKFVYNSFKDITNYGSKMDNRGYVSQGNGFGNVPNYGANSTVERERKYAGMTTLNDYYFVVFKEDKLYKLGFIYEFVLERDSEMKALIDVLRKDDF